LHDQESRADQLFALFTALNEPWKGCVEARPKPYDVTDEPPNTAIPNTLFVPYFWIDDGDKTSRFGQSGWPKSSAKLYNNYVSDSPIAGSNQSNNYDYRSWSVYKYDVARTGSAVSIDTSPPTTEGPNQACPTPILPLTGVRSAVISALDSMTQWDGGGTNSAEGLMWGWLVLSPGEPFTQGAPYNKARKVIVLFGDGLNNGTSSDNITIQTEGGTYNHLRAWTSYATSSNPPAAVRLSVSNQAPFNQYIDSRQRQACSNAKAADVQIYTVLFRESDVNAKAVYADCASDVSKAFTAANTQQLKGAFADIAKEIAKLRLTE
jgi:hypothetical protein